MTWVTAGEWKPDEAMFGVGTISSLLNIYPNTNGYNPIPEFLPISTPIIEDGEPAVVTGSKSFVLSDGHFITVAGTDKNLYLLEQAEWTNISKTGGYNGQGQPWQFAMYGDLVMATNYYDSVQCINIKSGEKQCSDLSETAPRATCIAVVNEFVVLGNTVDTYDNARPGRVWWGPIGNPKGEWTPNQTTMCDYQDQGQGAYVVNIVGGEDCKIFMRDAIIRMTFVGSPQVFQFDVIEPNRGCTGINALTSIGEIIFFLASDGFFMMSGASLQQIGLNKVDNYVLKRFAGGLVSAAKCVADPRNKCVWWAIPKEDLTARGILLNEILIFHYPSGKWGRAENNMTLLHEFYTKDYSLDELDQINEILEDLPFPLDSVMYKGGSPVIGGFDKNGTLCYCYGKPMPAEFITGDIPLVDHQKRGWLNRLRMGVDGDNKHKIAVASKQVLSDAVSYVQTSEPTRIGDYAFRVPGRYHRIKFTLGGDWNNFTGFDVDVKEEGTQ